MHNFVLIIYVIFNSAEPSTVSKSVLKSALSKSERLSSTLPPSGPAAMATSDKDVSPDTIHKLSKSLAESSLQQSLQMSEVGGTAVCLLFLEVHSL